MITDPINDSIGCETALETSSLAFVESTQMGTDRKFRPLVMDHLLRIPVASLLDEIARDVPAGSERFGDLAALVLAGLGMVRGIPHSQLQILFPGMDETELDSRIQEVLMDVRFSVWYFAVLDRFQERFTSSIEPHLSGQMTSMPVSGQPSVGAGRNRPFTKMSMMPIPNCA